MSSDSPETAADTQARIHRFPRRLLNPAVVVYLAGGGLFGYGSWYLYNAFPTLWGAGLSLFTLGLAVYNLQLLFQQPMRVSFRPDAMVVQYPFHRIEVAYDRIERLHWFQHLRGLDTRRLQVLKIETKDGTWIRLDYMKGQLRRIRGILDKRVYGDSM